MHIKVLKANGESEDFNEGKLLSSLHHAGVRKHAAQEILDKVSESLYNGISTKEIYREAYALLRNKKDETAARYNLKRAIMDFGPSGFPFERYIGELLKHQGFKVQVGVKVKGQCVTHEVDVVAEKEDRHFMIECKFHNQQGYSTDVKIPLYVNSRFLDIEKEWKLHPGHETRFHQGWLVTNTRFSTDAIQYGECAGLHLVGWNYPKKDNLREMIDAAGLHPVTALSSLSSREKSLLLEQDIVLCRDISDKPFVLKSIGIKDERAEDVLRESKLLSGRE